MNRTIKLILGIVLIALVAAGSFYGGMLYGKSQAQAALPTFEVANGPQGIPGQGLPPGAQGGRAFSGSQAGASGDRGGMLAGEILSIDGGTLTLEDSAGNKITVHVTDTTLIQKQADVSVDDLEAGETVFVSGTKADDGSYTARSVQVSPGGAFMMPGGSTGGAQPGSNTGGTNP